MTHNKKMEELLEDPINEELYGLFLKVKNSPRHIAINAESLFNEVYYLCAKLPKEKDPSGNLSVYAKEIETDLGWHYAAELVFPMLYAILKSKKRLSKKMLCLMETMEKNYGDTFYWNNFARPLAVVKKRHPQPIRIDTRDLLMTLEKYHVMPMISVQQAEINVNSPGNIVGKEINYK